MKLMKMMILPVVVALTLTACSKEDGKGSVAQDGAIRFVTAGEITRTHFGKLVGDSYPTYWTGNESVAVLLNYTASAEAAITASADYKSASFSAVLEDDGSENYSFCVISPVAVFKDKSADNKRIMINIPSEQTPLTGSCDEAAQVVAAYTEPVTEFPSEVTLSFRHISAYGLLTIKNLEDGSIVQSIKLTSSKSISGRIYWFPETDVVEPHSSKASNEIILTTSSAENVWLAMIPTDLSGSKMTVDVTTDKGLYSKEVTLPADRNLAAGHIATLTFDFSGITPSSGAEDNEPIAAVGDVWKENGKAVGVVFYVAEDGNSAKIVSLDRTETTVAWSTEGGVYLGAGSKTDGAANTSVLKSSAQASSMPILSFCASHGEGWYWPACNELHDIYLVKEQVEAALTANGGTAFGSDQYWSSTEFEDAPKYASHVRFDRDYVGTAADQLNKTGATKRYGRCVKVVNR